LERSSTSTGSIRSTKTTTTTTTPTSYNNDDNYRSTTTTAASSERNRQLIDRFLQSIRSDVTRRNALDYMHIYMRYWHLYEEKNAGEDGEGDEHEQEEQHQLLSLLSSNGVGGATLKNRKTRQPRKYPNHFYRYDWLLYNKDIQTIQDRIIEFVIAKKKEGRGANAIDNYINPLWKFYRVHGVKGIDWEMVRSFKPDYVKKTHDREYHPEEIIKIEDKLDVRGKVVMGLMRGSGVRRGAEPTISIGDLFPSQTKLGKIYKIWVYRGSPEMYPTACTPEIARKIDDYLEYRMRFGEHCKLFGKSDHKHEYYNGYNNDNDGDDDDSCGEEVAEKWYKADEPHLDPDAPLIREDFDKTDSLAAKHPRRISDKQITHIISNAAIAAGVRTVMKGADPSKRHRVMITHGNRKFFKKRCRQAKVHPLILERLLGHKSGNPKEGISKLMMTYDAEDWAEMQQEFEKAIPHLTISKDALIQAELEQAKAQLKNVPIIEQLQGQLKESEEQKKKEMQTMTQKFDEMQAKMSKMYEAIESRGVLRPIDAETIPIDAIPPHLLKYFLTPWPELDEMKKKNKNKK
jgi:hypothetical protein